MTYEEALTASIEQGKTYHMGNVSKLHEAAAELFARNVAIDALEQYSLFLEDQGYLDTDWRAEEPMAIGEFLKSEFNKQDVMH